MPYGVIFTPPEATNTGPGFNWGARAAPGGVVSKNGQGHMRIQRKVISYMSVCVIVLVCRH